MPSMKWMRYKGDIVFAALLVFALAGCSGQKDAAQTLVAEITATVSAAAPEAAKYVPELLGNVEAKLTDLQALLDKKDYAAVMAAAPAVLAASQSLATDAAAKKDAILKVENDDWTNLAAVLPDRVTALQKRFDQLNALKPAKKAAAGVDLTAASAGVADITSLWSKSQAAFAGGNLDEAVATAKDLKAKADALAVTLKLNP